MSAAKFLRLNGVKAHEVEPGRSVVNDWDRALREPYADRKARLMGVARAYGLGRQAAAAEPHLGPAVCPYAGAPHRDSWGQGYADYLAGVDR